MKAEHDGMQTSNCISLGFRDLLPFVFALPSKYQADMVWLIFFLIKVFHIVITRTTITYVRDNERHGICISENNECSKW